MRKVLRRPAAACWVLAVAVALGIGTERHIVGQQRPPTNSSGAGSTDVEVLQVQPDLYLIAGAGANIAVQVGHDGVVVVDSGSAAGIDRVLAEIQKLTKQPIRYIINTSADPDHVGGNEKLSAAGQSIIPTGGLNSIASAGGRAVIFAEERVLARMSAPVGKQAAYPNGAWPTSSYSASLGEFQKDVYLNGQAIQVFHQPAAHSDGDSIVFFRRSDVLVIGDVMDTTHFPVIDLAKGGSVQGVIDSLNRIIAITVPPTPLVWQEGGTVVIPGHGRICDEADVVDYRDMMTIVRDNVQDMIKKNMTLDQVQKADPTKRYRKRYGADSGPWTTNQFVEAVYKSLSGKG
jgi:glyoxylase-like metal-dependent hydrolase (beta-lactamase superfamily II)